MRVTTSRFALLALPALINAVSLSDMTPRAENLPAACEKIYSSQISGCGVTDFTTRTCSNTCIKALEALVDPIQTACGGQGLQGSNLVVAFLAGVGPEQVCTNAPSSSGGGQSSAAPASSTPSPSPSPTPSSPTAESSALLVDTSSDVSSARTTRTPEFTGTSTASSLNTERTTSALTTDTSSSTTTAAGASQTTSSSGNEQLNLEDHSGGGSPFDTAGNSGADSLSSTSVLVSLAIAFIVMAFLFR